MKGSIMRMSWAPRGAFFVVLFAALMLATSAAAQACPPGHTYQDVIHCRSGGLIVATYTCNAFGGWYNLTNWYVVWGCGS